MENKGFKIQAMTIPKRTTQPEEGAALREWREGIGVKQSVLAKRAGLSQNLVSLLEAGKRNFTEDSSEKIYRAQRELNAERAEKLTAVALTQDSRSVAIERLRHSLLDKKTPALARDFAQLALRFAANEESLRSRLHELQQKEEQKIGPAIAELKEQIMEHEIKPLTAELNKMRHELADMRRLVGIKTEAAGKQAEAEDLQEQIGQRVRRGK